MAGPVACLASRLPPYRESRLARLCRPALPLVALLTLAALNGGCAMSNQLGSLFGSDSEVADSKAQPETTGSVPPSSGLPPERDLAYTKAAATELLARGNKDTSAPWENPLTGARGTVTPLAASYMQDGVTCRDFLASYLRTGTEAWMQGEACRKQKGKWEVRTLKPWTRSS
jgi:surface antigen